MNIEKKVLMFELFILAVILYLCNSVPQQHKGEIKGQVYIHQKEQVHHKEQVDKKELNKDIIYNQIIVVSNLKTYRQSIGECGCHELATAAYLSVDFVEWVEYTDTSVPFSIYSGFSCTGDMIGPIWGGSILKESTMAKSVGVCQPYCSQSQ